MSELDLVIMQKARDELVKALNAGEFEKNKWQNVIQIARELECHAIADQLEKYYNHYSEEMQ